jgi:hypothetical protein
MQLILVVAESRLKYNMDLILWSLVVFGFTTIVTISSIFEPFRKWWFKGYKWIPHDLETNEGQWILDGSRSQLKIKIYWKIGELLKCPLCTGFWAGILFSLLWFSPTGLKEGNFFFDALLGSSVCWLFHSLVWKLALKDNKEGG